MQSGTFVGFAFLASSLTPPSATALFWFALPPDSTAAISEEVPIYTHDLGRPVVTFALVAGSPDCVWVSLDTHWPHEGSSADVSSLVRLVRVGPDLVRRALTYSVLSSLL